MKPAKAGTTNQRSRIFTEGNEGHKESATCVESVGIESSNPTLSAICLQDLVCRLLSARFRLAGLTCDFLMIVRTVEQVRRAFRIVAGFTLLLAGVVMIVTPGPGWLVIFLGLGLLHFLLLRRPRGIGRTRRCNFLF